MELKKHEIWKVFSGAETFELFQKNYLKPIYLKTSVNIEVKKHIIAIEKLLIHSYYEYEFIDVAITLAVITLEKALSLRLDELNIPFKENRTLNNLSKWFFNNNYFETWNMEVIDQLRSIRNKKVHDETKSLGGSVFLAKIYTALDLINDIYEDVDLRIKRKDDVLKWHKEFETFLPNGCILSSKSINAMIYTATVVFINNKLASETTNIVVTPIFDLKPYQEGRLITPKSHLLSLQNIKFNGTVLTGFDETGNEIRITKNTDAINLGIFESWRRKLLELRHYPSILHSNDLNVNKFFFPILRDFHHMP